jgi:hypothetical protein
MATVHLTYLAFAAPAESRIEATVYQSHSMMTAGFHRHLGTASNPSGPRYALSALSRTNRPTTSFLVDDQLGDHLSRGRELSYLSWAEHIGFARTSPNKMMPSCPQGLISGSRARTVLLGMHWVTQEGLPWRVS